MLEEHCWGFFTGVVLMIRDSSCFALSFTGGQRMTKECRKIKLEAPRNEVFTKSRRINSD